MWALSLPNSSWRYYKTPRKLPSSSNTRNLVRLWTWHPPACSLQRCQCCHCKGSNVPRLTGSCKTTTSFNCRHTLQIHLPTRGSLSTFLQHGSTRTSTSRTVHKRLRALFSCSQRHLQLWLVTCRSYLTTTSHVFWLDINYRCSSPITVHYLQTPSSDSGSQTSGIPLLPPAYWGAASRSPSLLTIKLLSSHRVSLQHSISHPGSASSSNSTATSSGSGRPFSAAPTSPTTSTSPYVRNCILGVWLLLGE